MTNLITWWDGILVPPTTVPLTVVCAAAAAPLLALFTRWMGLGTLLLHFCVLFTGAYLANVLGAGLDLPFERHYVRPILMSFLGMLVSSLLVMWLLPKTPEEG